MTAKTHHRLDLSAVLASVIVALVLVALKLWALAVTGSLAVAASLADSGLDLMVAIAGLAAIVYAARPPDEDHSFGHTSAEDLAALGQAVFMAASACVIIWAAVRRLTGDEPVTLTAEGRGIAAMIVSIVLMLALVAWQHRVARQTGSRVVAANSMHYLGDLFPNIGAILSLAASGRLGMHQIDSECAM